MPLDVDAMAAEVVLLVKSALAPVLATQAAQAALIASLEARWNDIGVLRERLAVVETKAAQAPVVPAVVASEPDAALVDLRARVAALEPHTVDLAALRERMAVLETKAPVPGPRGDDGKDGIDGLGFEDLDVALEGDRTLAFRFAKGDKEITRRVIVGWPIGQKNWVLGKAYVPGDLVSWDGSLWSCLEATDEGQPGVSKCWYKSVSKGARGQDGHDGKHWAPPPVVSVGVR